MIKRPILFNTEMVKAILSGSKTQTRRVIKPQPPKDDDPKLDKPLTYSAFFNILNRWWIGSDPGWYHCFEYTCPYGKPGDRLWVRETWAKDIPGCPNGVTYRADHLDPKGDGPANPIKWRPSIFMPRWASRITLEITDVRVERVQEISESDAQAELGAPDWTGPGEPPYQRDLITCFAILWDSINAKRGYGFDKNPWVWVLEFKQVEVANV